MRAFVQMVAILAVIAVFPVGTAHYSATAQTSEDRALTVLAAARAAIGGESRIAGVKTFIANGRTRQVRGENLIPIEFEIQAELPDKYARRDEFPAQDNGPATTGFSGEALIDVSAAPPAGGRAGAATPTPEQQQTARRARVTAIKQDFARLMLGMFVTTYNSFPLTFAYVAQAEAPQGKADVIDVIGPGTFRARLFVSSETHLPIMLTWQAPAAPGRGRGPAPPEPSAGPPAAAVEQRMYFGEYREIDGFRLPFRIRRAVGAETIEETTFDRFRINARVDPRRFETGN